MRAFPLLLSAALLAASPAAQAQSGATQSRDGLGAAAHPNSPTNSLPSGSENANTGPQSRPAYPSGSDTPNPGAAFVRNAPKPATGPLGSEPGVLSTTTIQSGATTTHPGGPATVGTEGAGK